MEYQDNNAYAHAKQIVEALMESHFGNKPIMGFEKQPPPGFAAGKGKKKGGRKGKNPHQHLLLSQLIYCMLSERGLECYWLEPKHVREYFGTFSLGSSGDADDDYESSKARSVAKFKELIGDDKYEIARSTYGKKIDDVADAFLLCLYLKENYEAIKAAKENNHWKEFKSKAKKKPKLQKRVQQMETCINPSKLNERLEASHIRTIELRKIRDQRKKAKKALKAANPEKKAKKAVTPRKKKEAPAKKKKEAVK